MKEKSKEFFKISDENILIIVLALMSFSIGIWSNYRQLWLENNGFSVTSISRILSVALICSAVIAFIISLFSSKIKVKSLILESIVLRIISMSILLFNKDIFVIKTCMLVCIMCEVIYLIAYYPLLSFFNKSEDTFRKKNLVDFISKDAGIVTCGLLIGVVVGNRVFDYDSCLFIAIMTCMLSGIVLLLVRGENTHHKRKGITLMRSINRIFKSKKIDWFLSSQLLVNISYGIIFDLIMLILTGYINFEVSFASIFIIVCNILGSLACSFFNRKGKKYSVKKSAWIKFGTRGITYLIAFLTNNTIVFIISIVVAYVTSRILEDKVLGTFLNKIDDNDKFLFENIRYFITCIGEGIGAFIAGILLLMSFRMLFLGAGIVTILQVLVLVKASKIRE